MRLVAPALVAIWSTSALASTQTGQITVTVKNVDGQPIEGATLELSSPNLIGGAREAKTDAKGEFRYIQLPPGSYTVAANHGEYRSTKGENIAVKIGYTSNIEVVMARLDAGVEEIVVTGVRPTIDTERMVLGGSITDQFLETIPSIRSYQNVSLLLPGVVDSNGNGNVNVMGGTDYGNQYLLDGINITDPVTNTFSANFNFDAMQQVEVLTGGRDAEYGSAQGGVINIVTRSGGNDFNADMSVYYQNEKLQLTEEGEENLKNSSLRANVNLGGPIIQDKLWYFVSAEMPWTQRGIDNPESGSPFADVDRHPDRDFLGFYALGKLTWQASNDHLVKVMFQTDPARIENTRQSAFVHPDAERKQIQTGFRLSAISEYFVSDDTVWTNRLSYNQNALDIKPMSGDEDLAGHNDGATGLTTINDYYWYEDTRIRLQYHTSLAHTVPDLFGEHQFKVGLDASYTRNNVYDSMAGGMYYYDNGGQPSSIDVLAQAQDTSIWGDTESLFVQDVWKPLSNLTIRPGLRFDSARMRNWEGDTQVVMNTLSPRFGVVYDPFDDGKTAIRAGYYQYVDTGYLTLSDFAGGNSQIVNTYNWNPVTQAYDDFYTQSGGPSGVVGKDYLKETWDQQRPRTHEFLFGFGRELMPNLGVNVDFTYRYSANGWEDTEENLIWDAAGENVIGFRDGQARYVYSLGALEESFVRYYGVSIAFEKSFSDNWMMLASYTWSKTEGTEPSIINESFDRPYMREFEFGYLPTDNRHVVKLDGSYRLPFGFILGGHFAYYSGEPYDRYIYNSFFRSYSDRAAKRGYDIDGSELRLPARLIANLRMKWDAEELTGQKFEVIAEANNIFNRRTATEVEDRDLPDGSFGTVTAKQAPTSFMLGMRYRY